MAGYKSKYTKTQKLPSEWYSSLSKGARNSNQDCLLGAPEVNIHYIPQSPENDVVHRNLSTSDHYFLRFILFEPS